MCVLYVIATSQIHKLRVVNVHCAAWSLLDRTSGDDHETPFTSDKP